MWEKSINWGFLLHQLYSGGLWRHPIPGKDVILQTLSTFWATADEAFEFNMAMYIFMLYFKTGKKQDEMC